VLAKQAFIHAQTAKSVDVATVVFDNVKSLITTISDEGGEWDKITNASLQAASNIITKGVNMFLGGGSAEDRTDSGYQVAAEGLSLIRLDWRAWMMTVKAESIKTQVDTIVVYSAIKSTVDVNKLSFNGFLNVYLPMLMTLSPEGKGDLKELVEKGREIYQQFGGMAGIERGAQITPELIENHKALMEFM
jgi:hypothetical protein